MASLMAPFSLSGYFAWNLQRFFLVILRTTSSCGERPGAIAAGAALSVIKLLISPVFCTCIHRSKYANLAIYNL
ncbi:MAG: hypothetical protein NTX79_06420 [Candidatus Micrarchaeota archaeon]|nr:hypothetical protein [Candidatus Micrarchaeota archaeon]